MPSHLFDWLNFRWLPPRPRRHPPPLPLIFIAIAFLVIAPTCAEQSRTLVPSAGSEARGAPTPARGPLRVLATNPRYFTDGTGQAVYLAGSHNWANFLDLSNSVRPFDYDAYIHFMVSHQFNFMRLWTFWFSHGLLPCCGVVSGPYPWIRTGPGNADDGDPRFDFTKLDQRYFDRLRSRVATAAKNGIYVSVMLFQGYEFQFAKEMATGNPFLASNNVNGVDCGGTCPTDRARMSEQVWDYERAYLRKVVDSVSDLDNVLYEVSNEAGSPYSDAWQASVIAYVNRYEETLGKRHPIGMTYQHKGGMDATLYASDAEWVSPGAMLPPENDGIKVVINDTDHSFYYTDLLTAGTDGQREWVWENFTRGNNVAFMDPYLTPWTGRNSPVGPMIDPLWNEIRNAMTDVRQYAMRIGLDRMTPQDHLIESGGFCLAEPGQQYLVFHPALPRRRLLDRVRSWLSSDAFTLAIVPGKYSYEWFDPSTHTVIDKGRMTVDGPRRFIAPFAGASVLWLRRDES